MPTLLSNILAAFAPGRSAAGPDEFRAGNDQALDRDSAANPEPLLDLSLAGHVLLPIAIFATSLITIEFSHLSNLIATVWPSNAIMLVALLRHSRSLRNYASIFVGGSAANALASLLAGNSATLSAALPVANFVEVAAALVLLDICKIGASNLTSFRNLLVFIVIAGGIAPIGSAMISAIAFGAAHGVSWLVVWRNWYPGHALGMIIVAPFLVSVTSSEWRALDIRQRLPEIATIVTLSVAVCICASYFRSVIFVMAPAILFVTIRYGLIGAALATFATALIASSFVVMGLGQPLLSQPELSERILALQVFLAITSF